MPSEQKVILVTGASSGIGEATARLLASQGHTVVLGSRRLDRIDRIAAEIRGCGHAASAQQLDVTDRADVDSFVKFAHTRHGRIDVLVNNAGVMPLSRLDELKVDEWERMIDVNLRGVLYGIAAVLPIMTAQKSGHVINIASVAARSAGPTTSVYSATKYAVRAITESLRTETPILRATLVSPGITQTELFDSISSAATRDMFQGLTQIAIPALAIAEAIAFAVAQPASVDINELVVRPTALQL
ncbi:SDR family oxidoreductase [Ottowia thiooxydans]|uniref:SDR family oxidoreductase n=1 Tax=Ottowia thiooxydans TaxID=219182 RepID=UPI000414E062|nr:SDR family oxidoreductase [Ottowia thiooxydans]